jgi:surfactin synthase thioesterase subunit
LPAEVEVCPVQLPGRESRLREPRYDRLGPLLEDLLEALSPFLRDLPFAFFGHSMGAIISFELCHALAKNQQEGPRILLLSGRRAPHVEDTDKAIHDLPEEEFKEELRSLNGTPEEVLNHPELMDLLAPVLRADFAVCETYEPILEPVPGCGISAFGGLGDSRVSKPALEAWSRYTEGPFKVRMYPGDHFFLNGSARSNLLYSVAQDLVPLLAAGR